MWHVSIACQSKRGPVDVKSLDDQTKNFIVNLGKSILEGVGIGEWYVKFGDKAIHIRRMLSYHEVEGMTHEWLAIPAVDMA